METPDFSQQMQEMSKPTAAETAQHKLGTEAQRDYMRDIIGTERAPGVGRQYSDAVERIGNPGRIEFQKGQAVGGNQMGFDGSQLLRSAAIKHAGGSGVAEGGLRTGFSALNSAQTSGTAGVNTKTIQEQNKARLGIAKIGQGMSDAIIAGYNNLSANETEANRTALRATIMDAERRMDSQEGLMKAGGQVLGGMTSAATKSFDENGFNFGTFGKNLATGWSGGLYRGAA